MIVESGAPWPATLYALLFLSQAAVIVWASWRWARLLRRPTTPGVILEACIEEDSGGRQRPRITYEYFVGGTRYQSSDFWWIEPTYQDMPGSAARNLGSRERGDRVIVAYDPRSPAEALVIRKPPFWAVSFSVVAFIQANFFILAGAEGMTLLVPLVCTAAGCWATVSTIRTRRWQFSSD
jgi:hypothetical protein